MINIDRSNYLWLDDEAAFNAMFNRRPFSLRHRLCDSAAFELPRLLELAQFLRVRGPFNVYFDAGEVSVEHRWNQRPRNSYTLEDAFNRINEAGAWIILKHTELDPDYANLMESVMSDIQRMRGQDLRKTTKNLEAQIMITSPRRVTPYHLDNECNVLLQIKGEKDIFVFDPTDREIVTEVELEHFWVGNVNAGEYKERCQNRANQFRLAPGRAVHIPVTAPHWVKNDDNVSISLSINFEWKDESIYNTYRANYFLRKLGVKPRPPGQSNLSEAVKSATMALSFVPLQKLARRSNRWYKGLVNRRRLAKSSEGAQIRSPLPKQ